MTHREGQTLAVSQTGRAEEAAEPDFYQLLGLAPFEPSTVVIEAKARELIREERKYQVGRYAARTQSRLEAYASATACLLDPERKRVYDDQLRRRFGLPPVSVASTYAAEPPERTTDKGATSAERSTAFDAASRRRVSRIALVAAVILILGLAVDLVQFRSNEPPGKTAGERMMPAAHVAALPQRPLDRRPGDVKLPDARKGLKDRQREAQPAEEGEGSAPQSPPNVPREFRGPPAESFEASGPDLSPRPNPRPKPAEEGLHQRRPPSGRRPGLVAGPAAPTSPAVPPIRPIDGGERPLPGVRPSAATESSPDETIMALTSEGVLKELRDLRLRRTAAARLSNDPRKVGWSRALELVRYARAAFANDRRFQRQLDQEVTALKRLYPQIRELLRDEPN